MAKSILEIFFYVTNICNYKAMRSIFKLLFFLLFQLSLSVLKVCPMIYEIRSLKYFSNKFFPYRPASNSCSSNG